MLFSKVLDESSVGVHVALPPAGADPAGVEGALGVVVHGVAVEQAVQEAVHQREARRAALILARFLLGRPIFFSGVDRNTP